MKVTIKYHYEMEHIPPRCKNVRIKEVHESAEVDIRELTDAEAPVGIMVTNFKTRNGKSGYYKVPFRWWKGKLYEPDFKTYGTNELAPSTIKDVAEQLNWYCSIGKLKLGQTSRDKAQQVKDAAAGYIIVDGKVYKRANEPHYSITTFGLGNNHGGTGFFIKQEGKGYDPNSHVHFNANQRKEALSAFRRIALGRGDTQSARETPKENINVLIPECVKLPLGKALPPERFEVCLRVLDKQGKLIGYDLYYKGQTKQVPVKECIRLAGDGMLNGVKLVSPAGKSPYLQGVKKPLSSLPSRQSNR